MCNRGKQVVAMDEPDVIIGTSVYQEVLETLADEDDSVMLMHKARSTFEDWPLR